MLHPPALTHIFVSISGVNLDDLLAQGEGLEQLAAVLHLAEQWRVQVPRHSHIEEGEGRLGADPLVGGAELKLKAEI